MDNGPARFQAQAAHKNQPTIRKPKPDWGGQSNCGLRLIKIHALRIYK